MSFSRKPWGRAALVAAFFVAASLVWAGLAGGIQPDDGYQATVAGDSPVAQYRFEDELGSGTLADSAGSNTATNSGIALGQEGPFGGSNSGAFDGEAYASLMADPLAAAEAFTAEAWVDWTGGTSYDQPIFDLGTSSTNHMYLTPASSLSGHEMIFEIDVGGVSTQLVAPKLKSNTWEYLAATESKAGTVTLYVDGQQVAQSSEWTANPSSLGSTSDNYLGQSIAGEPRFEGSLSNVAFYDAELTAGQIEGHYNAGELPVNTVAPAISGAARSGDSLTASEGTWTGLSPITYSYRWQRCDSSGESCSDIPGATEASYSVSGEDIGSKLRVWVIASNSAASEEAISETTPVVGAGTETAGLSDPTQDLLIQPSVDPQESRELDLTGETPVFFVQAMPKSMTVASVTLGDFARAASCEDDASVELEVYAFAPGSNLSNGKLIATSIASRPFGSTLGPVTWQLPPTELALDATYGFFVKAGSGSCKAGVERNWAHNGSVVDGGESACAEMLGVAGAWRLWHSEGAADSGACAALDPLSNFDKTLPTGWEQVQQSSEEASIDTTPSECAAGLASELSYGEGSVVCQFPQFTQPGETTPDGWYYGLPWEGPSLAGTPRDLYFRLDPAPPPTGTLIVPPSEVTNNSAKLSAVIDPRGRHTSYRIKWTGPAGSKGFLPELPHDIGAGNADVTVTQEMTGLEPSATYHYYLTLYTPNEPPIDERIGSSVYSGSFTTLAEAATPEASTGTASGVTSTAALLAGTVTPAVGDHTHYQFEWGTEAGLAAPARSTIADAGSGSSAVAVSHELSSLRPSTQYYFRVVAINSQGVRTEGEIESFTTSVGELTSTAPPSIEGPIAQGETAFVVPGTWAPANPDVGYQWERCNPFGEECAPIEGATGEAYEPVEADLRSTLRVTESAEDPEGATATVASAPSEVTQPMSMLVWPLAIPSITGLAIEGQTLIAGHGEWTGEAPLGYAYLWQRCNAAGGECSDIAAASEATYSPAAADVGSTIRLKVTASSSGAFGVATSDASAVVAEPDAVPSSAPTISGSAEDGQTLTASPGVWSGVSEPAYTYQWLRCDDAGAGCEVLAAATGDTYELTAADLTSTLRVLVSVHGSSSWGQAISAATAAVEETAPAVVAAPSIVGAADAGEELQAEPGQWVGLEPSFAFQWQRCNSSGGECADVLEANEQGYVLGASDIGHTLRVVVVASNELGSVSDASAVTAVVGEARTLLDETAPSIGGVPRAGETFSAAHGTWTGSGTLSYGYRWERCNEYGGDCSAIPGATGAEYTLGEADIGKSVELFVTAKDANGSEDAESPASQPIAASGGPAVSAAPTISGVTQQGETLSATPGTLTGAETPTNAYRWLRCSEEGTECTEIEGATSASYTLIGQDVGSTIRVAVTATTGAGSAVGLSAPDGEVSPAHLHNVSIPAVSGSPRDGETLTASTGTWTGQGSLSYEFQWQRCGSSGADCADIEGADKTTYTLGEADVGGTVRVVVTATGLWGSVHVPSDATPPVGDALLAPTEVALPAITGTDVAGQTLSAETGEWEGAATLVYAYQWKRCDSEGGECEAIGGASAVGYRLVPADVGHTLIVTVTASNAVGEASASSPATATVAATEIPVPAVLPSISGTAEEGMSLTAVPGEWSGAEPISYEYQWERCDASGAGCVSIAGAVEAGYEATADDVGRRLRVATVATNGEGSAEANSATSAVVKPVPPSAFAPTTLVGHALVGATLSLNVSGEHSAETPAITYLWQSCNAVGEECANLAGATHATYVPVEGDLGQTLRAVVTFTNSSGEDVETTAVSEEVQSMSAPVQIEAPMITASSLGGSLFANWTSSELLVRGAGAIVTVSPGTWYGVMPLSYSYQWERCTSSHEECVPILGATQSTYITPESGEPYVLSVIVTATNVDGSAEAEASVSVDLDGPPAVEVAPWVGGFPYIGNTVTAEPGEWSPVPTSYSYQWYRCRSSCTLIAGATEASYLVTEADERDWLQVKVTATDEYGSASVSAESERVEGALAANTEPPPIYGEAVAGNRLEAGTGSWTNAVVFSYDWQLCDATGGSCVDIPGANGERFESYATTAAEAGHTIRVIVTGRNGLGGATSTSAPTPVLAAPEAPADTSAPTVEGTARTGQTLNALPGSWTGTPAVAYTYAWQRCDLGGGNCLQIASGAERTSYMLGAEDVDHTIRVAVTASNAGGHSTAFSQATATVTDADAPLNAALPTLESGPLAGEAATVGNGEWTGAEPISYSLQWERCNEAGEACASIAEATESTYWTTAADEGHRLRVRETASNALGHASVLSLTGAPVGTPVSPANTAAPTVEGAPEAGVELSANSGEWEGGAVNSFSFQWERCNEAGEACASIPEATGSSYATGSEDAGHTFRVLVTATNLSGEATATSAVTEVITMPAAPANAEVPVIEGASEVGEELSATTGEWTGGSVTEYAYLWRRCNSEGEACSEIAEATASTYVPTVEDVGHELRVSVTATNLAGGASAESAPTSPIALAAAPENLVSPTLPLGAPTEFGVKVWIEAGSWSAHPSSIAYQWERCDPLDLDPETHEPTCVTIAGATEPEYTPQMQDVGYLLRVTETATNASGSTSQTSGMTATTVSYEYEGIAVGYAGVAAAGQTIVAQPYALSNAKLPSSAEYEFVRLEEAGEPTVLQSGASPNYLVSSEDIGHVIEIRANIALLRADHEEVFESQLVTTETTTVAGAIVNSSPPVVAGDDAVGATVTAEPGGWSAGGEAVPFEYEYAWQLCDAAGESCTDIAEARGPTLYIRSSAEGGTLRVRVSIGETTALSEPTGVIGPVGSGPVDTTPPVVSGTAENGQLLSGSYGSWSASGSISYGYRWEDCNVESGSCEAIKDANRPTYRLSTEDVGKTVRLRITATSGSVTSSALSEATGTVGSVAAPENEALPKLTFLGPDEVGARIETDGGKWQRAPAQLLEYQWERCSNSGAECEVIAEASENSYRVSAADAGRRLRVAVTAANETATVKATSALSASISAGSAAEGEFEGTGATNHLVYVEYGSLYVANSSGEDPKQVLTCSQADPNAPAEGCEFRHPRISPDGQMIAVEELPEPQIEPREAGRILDLNYDGTGVRLLAAKGVEPRWAESGTGVRFENESYEILTVEADGSNSAQPESTEEEPGIGDEGEVSPDGTQRVFVASGELFTGATGTSERHALGIETLDGIGEPTFSPDGNRVIFVASPILNEDKERYRGFNHVYSIGTDGEGLEQLTTNFPYGVNSPAASADGSQIFMAGSKGACPDFAPRGTEFAERLEDGFNCNTDALVEGSASGGHERVVSVGPQEVSFWAHAASYKQVCPPGQYVCGTWNSTHTEAANRYSIHYAGRYNEAFYKFSEDDCTNFVSQLLFAGGMEMLRAFEKGKDSWWAKPPLKRYAETELPPPVHSYSTSWARAETLYHQLRNTGVAVPLKPGQTAHAGDIVFFHWNFEPASARINHVGMIVAGNDHDPSTEMYAQHQPGRRWKMTEEYRQIGIYLHEHNSSFSATDTRRGDNWQWFVLRPVHLGAYVPEN
jgi:Concanavalin A-like lectin/glucanases superfamily/Putative amidase domain/WD40-like Beta Propeller Repeat